MIVVIDYGVGNVKSVTNAVKYIGCETKVSCDPADIESADGLILPGVGACGYAMEKLGGLADVICDVAKGGKPLLGICLGFQILFDESFEHGTFKCLGLVEGKVVPIPAGRTIPHMGWNYVKFPERMDLFAGLGDGKHFAFAHSYYAEVTDGDAVVAYTDYGMDIAASVQKGNIFGCQFHPEKSGVDGLDVLRNFEKYCKGATC
ncbi:MAG: imidazole glycerol phosphate synthase subunit HisH [Planctomycetes bacterium]|nr:imidazole glycerol phosphate synthase subunit HisH [Planctomycetota bacterium]